MKKDELEKLLYAFAFYIGHGEDRKIISNWLDDYIKTTPITWIIMEDDDLNKPKLVWGNPIPGEIPPEAMGQIVKLVAESINDYHERIITPKFVQIGNIMDDLSGINQLLMEAMVGKAKESGDITELSREFLNEIEELVGDGQ